ncbi:hypothetical protein BGX24_003610, partial [Mortierella sp. AD032]
MIPTLTALTAMKCNTCGQLGHRRITHKNCLANRMLQPNAESTAPCAAPPAALAPATLAVPAALTALAVSVASAAPIAPAPPIAPAIPAIPPAAPIGPRVFGNGMAAINEHEQDDTVYRSLGRMNI